jgi:sporulation protein YlmC with PRC-barrel domain
MQHVVRDILDKQLVDARQRRIGKVDGLVLEARAGEPLRLAFIEVGAMTLGRRLHPRLEQWAASIERWLGVGKGEPYRIPYEKVRDIGLDVDVGIEVERTPILAWQRWVREKIIKRIPGA